LLFDAPVVAVPQVLFDEPVVAPDQLFPDDQLFDPDVVVVTAGVEAVHVLVLVTAVGAMTTGSMAKSSLFTVDVEPEVEPEVVVVVVVVIVPEGVTQVEPDAPPAVVPDVVPDVDPPEIPPEVDPPETPPEVDPPETPPAVDPPETSPVVDPDAPPVVVPAVAPPLVEMFGAYPPLPLSPLNKKIKPMIKPSKSNAPNKYQSHGGHPNPFFFCFLFSSTGSETVLAGAVTTSSLWNCLGSMTCCSTLTSSLMGWEVTVGISVGWL
jgi:hypothetical protein